MYNLIMIDTDWKKIETKKLEYNRRTLTYTDPDIKSQYMPSERNLNIEALKSLPTVFMKEGKNDQLAYIGKVDDVVLSGSNLYISYSLYSEIPPLKNELLISKHMDLKIDSHGGEFSRNHWAVKDADLFLFWLKNAHTRRQDSTVFELANYKDINPFLVSVMMPFDKKFTLVFEAMNNSCKSMQLECSRADDNDNWETPMVMQDIVNLIDKSSIVICDCSGKNSNVFYEMGIAHTLGKEVIVITQNKEDIPFDIQHLRYIVYKNSEKGLKKLEQDIASRIDKIKNS